MKFRYALIPLIGILLYALVAFAGNLNTSGKCPVWAACEIGADTTTTFTVTTDGGDVVLDGSIVSDLDITSTLGDFTATEGNFIATDGYVTGRAYVVNLASGALTLNAINIASATADYTLPACITGRIGSWVTVVVRDASETVSLVPDTGEIINYSGITPIADDELDSPTAGATTAGSAITLLCALDNTWQTIGTVGLWADGGSS